MNTNKSNLVIAFQGMPGAYSNMACEAYFPRAKTLPCNSFEDMLNATKKSLSDYSMVPVENSLAGRVADIHHLIPDSGLFIIGEHFQRVNHQLLGLQNSDLKDIKSVKSHAQGLAQCRKFISDNNLSRLTPVFIFIISNIPTRSSVARLPEEFGAKGHPPKPPIQESNLFIPDSILA